MFLGATSEICKIRVAAMAYFDLLLLSDSQPFRIFYCNTPQEKTSHSVSENRATYTIYLDSNVQKWPKFQKAKITQENGYTCETADMGEESLPRCLNCTITDVPSLIYHIVQNKCRYT